ncbi:iron chelate uptake ABC transporter family permease subunit, partial [Mycobacterium tuberculosis]|nr:iron chelate uptake ABC transporter family permease subunit [Mycobacterium tuberculosis]
ALDERIVLLVRLPRILLAALAGAGLALTGAALQAVFRNPLVSAQVLGISPGAAFGGVLAILMGWWGLALLGLVFAFGLVTLAVVGLVARVDGRSDVVALVLAGLVIGALAAAGAVLPSSAVVCGFGAEMILLLAFMPLALLRLQAALDPVRAERPPPLPDAALPPYAVLLPLY